MNTRFCERCSAEVEDVGGFCLLGHPLRLDPPIPSLAHVRQEVDRVLDEIRDERGHPGYDMGAGRAQGDVEPPPLPDRTAASGKSLWDSLRQAGGKGPHDPIEAFAPPPRMDWGPSEPSNVLQRTLRRAQKVRA